MHVIEQGQEQKSTEHIYITWTPTSLFVLLTEHHDGDFGRSIIARDTYV